MANEDHSKKMVETYLGRENPIVYGVTVKINGNTSSGATMRHVQVLCIENGNRVPAIVDISLYVANFLGLRRSKTGAIILKGNTIEEIATMLTSKLGYDVKASRL